uniref:Uncharacterized protein n=1 Tax=Glossina pallidipes TaxID=7398 RepID=A0A1B0A870_GLOPL
MELGHVAAIYIKYHDCLKAKNIAFPSVYKYKDWIRFVDEQLDDDDTVYEIYDADSFPGHNNANNNRDDYYSFYNDYDIDYMHDMDESARFLAQGGNYPDYSSNWHCKALRKCDLQLAGMTSDNSIIPQRYLKC